MELCSWYNTCSLVLGEILNWFLCLIPVFLSISEPRICGSSGITWEPQSAISHSRDDGSWQTGIVISLFWNESLAENTLLALHLWWALKQFQAFMTVWIVSSCSCTTDDYTFEPIRNKLKDKFDSPIPLLVLIEGVFFAFSLAYFVLCGVNYNFLLRKFLERD